MRIYQKHTAAHVGCASLIRMATPYFDRMETSASTYGATIAAAPDSPGRANKLRSYPISRRSRRR